MFCFFFFQAEDGIRDLVRSRGLGDVYKRQTFNFSLVQTITPGSGYFIDIASCPNAANVIAVFENPDQPHFIIYPNPARDITTIKFDNTSMLEIRDNLGVLMETISVQGMTECRINTSNWNTGVYFINALSTKKISTRSKLVIQ